MYSIFRLELESIDLVNFLHEVMATVQNINLLLKKEIFIQSNILKSLIQRINS